jgi:hypothetical protein
MIGWQIRAAVGIAVLAALGGLFWHDRHQTKRANRLAAEKVTLEAIIDNERKLRAIEQADRRHADETAKALAAELADIRAEPRITGVRLCPRVAATVPAAGGSTSRTDRAAAGRVEGTAAADPEPVDVSDALDAYATDCAMVGAIARKWQEWDAARSH